MIIQHSKKNPKAPITSCEQLPEGCPKSTQGLGDKVERIAKPIAKVIDRVAHTNLQNCGGCKKRKEYLNEKFPS